MTVYVGKAVTFEIGLTLVKLVVKLVKLVTVYVTLYGAYAFLEIVNFSKRGKQKGTA